MNTVFKSSIIIVSILIIASLFMLRVENVQAYNRHAYTPPSAKPTPTPTPSLHPCWKEASIWRQYNDQVNTFENNKKNNPEQWTPELQNFLDDLYDALDDASNDWRECMEEHG